jgi:mannosyltransferase OCH1-like enzyme
MIPKKLHVIWIGDESKRPDQCIDTWRQHNPDWELKLWGNKEVEAYNWFNKKHLPAAMKQRLSGASNLLRFEILFNEGGFYVDADTVCMRPLAPWLFEHDCFVSWENELARPGLLATTFMAFPPADPYIRRLITDIHKLERIDHDESWKVTGPAHITRVWREMQYSRLSILPSHYFLGDHFEGHTYEGKGPVFARHMWGSTYHKNQNGAFYDTLHAKSLDEVKTL